MQVRNSFMYLLENIHAVKKEKKLHWTLAAMKTNGGISVNAAA